MDIVVNTINSKDTHRIEYRNLSDNLSTRGEKAFLSVFLHGDAAKDIIKVIEVSGGFPVSLIRALGGEGATTHTSTGSHSVIIDDLPHPNGRAVTTGHELFGHDRSWAAGYREEYQHEQTIRTENLILRVMGILFVNNGLNHGPETLVPQHSLLPIFR